MGARHSGPSRRTATLASALAVDAKVGGTVKLVSGSNGLRVAQQESQSPSSEARWAMRKIGVVSGG